MSLYAFTDTPAAPAPIPPTPAPQPMAPCDAFTSAGCFVDLRSDRIMDAAVFGAETMSAEVSARRQRMKISKPSPTKRIRFVCGIASSKSPFALTSP